MYQLIGSAGIVLEDVRDFGTTIVSGIKRVVMTAEDFTKDVSRLAQGAYQGAMEFSKDNPGGLLMSRDLEFIHGRLFGDVQDNAGKINPELAHFYDRSVKRLHEELLQIHANGQDIKNQSTEAIARHLGRVEGLQFFTDNNSSVVRMAADCHMERWLDQKPTHKPGVEQSSYMRAVLEVKKGNVSELTNIMKDNQKSAEVLNKEPFFGEDYKASPHPFGLNAATSAPLQAEVAQLEAQRRAIEEAARKASQDQSQGYGY